MYRAITTCLALPVFLICTAASAETISGALQNFGFAGIWSMDCSRDLRTQAGYRTTYSMPAAGPVTFTTIFRQPDGRTILMKSEVEAVESLSERKIQLTAKFTDIRLDNQSVPLRGIYAATLLITQEKVGSKIRLIDSRSVDGRNIYAQDGRFSNGTETPFLERCFE